jgi:hypothetical protein
VKRALIVGAALALAGCVHAPTGVLVLHLSPPDARVIVDGDYIGSAQQVSGLRLRMRTGRHRLEVGADGYYAARREPEVVKDGSVEMRVDLHAVPDGIRGD